LKEGKLMPRPPLRVYFGPDSDRPVIDSPSRVREEVNVPFGDLLPLIADAVNTRRAWLDDFQDDRVTISADLYEVLMAYRQLRSSA
jgi:hypothetical protein